MDIEEARIFLNEVMIYGFKDKTFSNYITNTLAGDFAVETAEAIQQANAERDSWKEAAIYCMAQIDEESPMLELANKKFEEALSAGMPKAG